MKAARSLFVRGPNVMRGYLDPTKPFGIDLLPQGWHDTGDVVDVDAEDGYIRILGRVKRFAKVGGEMVSLNAVESYALDRVARSPHTPRLRCPIHARASASSSSPITQGATVPKSGASLVQGQSVPKRAGRAVPKKIGRGR